MTDQGHDTRTAGEAIDTEAVLKAYSDHVSRGSAALARFMGGELEVRSAGPYITTSGGRQLLDCAGYGVFIFGHCHPAVVAAVQEQVARHPLSSRILCEPRVVEAATRLARLAPGDLQQVQFAPSGASAVEAGLKLARAHGRRSIVTMLGGYHGKTLGALSATPNPLYQDPFLPLLPSHTVRFGDVDDLERTLASVPDACVIVEPVQGEGGVVIPPDGYLAEVSRRCRAAGAFLIVDEIQTGLGRLGTLWGIDGQDVRPDALLVGKGLSGGVIPVAALVATPEAFAPFNADPFLHTSTFAGAPVAAAAADAALRVIEEEQIPQRAAALGSIILEGLRHVLGPALGTTVSDVRGRGLLIGVEFAEPGLVGAFSLELFTHGVLSNNSLNAHRVLRLTPPATLSPADVDWLLEAFEKAAVQVLGSAGHHSTASTNAQGVRTDG